MSLRIMAINALLCIVAMVAVVCVWTIRLGGVKSASCRHTQSFSAQDKYEASDFSILYSYSAGEHRDENFEFFLRFGIPWPCPKHLNFYLIVNGEWDRSRFEPLLEPLTSTPSSVTILTRENTGYDFCAWKFALSRLRSKTAYYVLINSSVRGPFLPNYARNLVWPEHFVRLMNESHGAKLGGLTINCSPKLHIQSMLLVFHASIYPLVHSVLGCYTDKKQVIQNCEVGLSQRVMAAGHNLAVMQRFWYQHDFIDNHASTRRKCAQTDNLFRNDPFYPDSAPGGISLHPYELLFFKTNRGVLPQVIAEYSRAEREMDDDA